MVEMYPLKDAFAVAKRMEDKDKKETFVTEEETKTGVANIFVSVGLMVFAILLGGILFWAYRKERALMIVFLSAFMFIFSVLIMSLSIAQRSKLDSKYFMFMTGSSIFMSVMMIIIIIIFSIITSRRLNKSYLGPQTQDYLSRTTEL